MIKLMVCLKTDGGLEAKTHRHYNILLAILNQFLDCFPKVKWFLQHNPLIGLDSLLLYFNGV